MATDVKKIKFVYFVYVHPKAFHLTSYKQNLFCDLCQLYWKITWDHTLASNICFSYRNMFQNGVEALSKIVDAFLSKSSKFYLVRIIR